MAQDIPEKPASGAGSPPKTTKKTSRMSKPKSTTTAKKKTPSSRPRKKKSVKASGAEANTAGTKAAKPQASAASTRTEAASADKSSETKEKASGVGNVPKNDAPIAGEKGPGMGSQNEKTEKGPDPQQGTEAVGVKLPENVSAKTATADTVSQVTSKTTWTPVLPKTHDVGDSSLPPEEEPDPMKKTLIYAGAALALIVFLIFVASLQNMRKYYVVERDDAVEIWKGRFSPMARQKLAVLPGVKPPAETKEVYTRRDVFPMLFAHYIKKADASMEDAGLPDFSKTRSILTQAGAYVTSTEDRAMINDRLQIIDRTVLIFKADLAAEKGTIRDLQAAQAHLGRAAALQPDAILASFLQQKMASIQEQIASLKAGPTPEQTLEAPAAETPPPTPKSDEHTAPETAPDDKAAPAARGTT